MPPIQSKRSIMETKPRAITAKNIQMPTTQHRKVYSELPMIDSQNTCNNIPVINSPAQFCKELSCFFPNDLERSFHLGLLSARATPELVPLEEGVKSYRSSDTVVTPETKLILQNYITSSDSSFGKTDLDFKDEEDLIVLSERSAHHFMKDGKVHQTYLSRKRTSKTGPQHLMTKRCLKTCDTAEDIAHCQVTEFNSAKEKSTGCEDTAVLRERYKNDESAEIDGSLKPQHCASSSKLAPESEPKNIVVNALSKREKHVTFANEVNERQILEPEKCHTSEEADVVAFLSSKPKFCEADEHPVVTSDWHAMNPCPEDSDFSDPPFPLSQKYGNHEVMFEDWKLTDQNELQELYEDHNVH